MQAPPPQQSATLDLTACETEPVHLINSVQPHGALFVLAEPDLRVLQASANAKSILLCANSEVVGQLAEDIFSDSSISAIKQILSSYRSSDDIWPAVPCTVSTRASLLSLQGLVHRYDGAFILELEREAESGLDELNSFRLWVSVDLPQLFEAQSTSQLFEQALITIQKMCDFDRVLVYQFDKEWNGSVIAEQRRDFMPSYLNHRFPAGDIPPQARNLYAKKLLRILVDVDSIPSPISPTLNPVTGRSLDLTYSILRSMSPVHIEYLRNMRVGASMSISLMVRNELWGLIACHHKTAKTIDHATRSKCELLAKVVSGLVEKIEDLEHTKGQLKLANELNKIVDALNKTDKFSQSLCLQLPDLVSITNASGIALVGDDVLEISGTTLDQETVKNLYSWLRDTVQEPIFHSDKLSVDYPQWREIASEVSGLIAIDISSTNSLWLLWFRPEQIEEVRWAGNPHKSVELEPHEKTLHPRKSFELWAESVRWCARPWKSYEIDAASLMQKHIYRLMLAEILKTEKSSKIVRQQREDLLAILTHDLTVPIMAIDRVLKPLIADETGKVPADIREILRVLQVANGNQHSRIHKLSQLLNYELGRVELTLVQIDCAELIRECLAEVLLQKDDVKIVSTIKQSDQSFQSDRESIKRLLVNLVDNAVCAVGKSGTIHVSCECSVSGLRIKVQDDGAGISPEDKVHLFKRFWHSDVTRTYSAHVGMGLYFCKRIVENLNGTITCESEAGKGSSFTVFVPSSSRNG